MKRCKTEAETFEEDIARDLLQATDQIACFENTARASSASSSPAIVSLRS